MHTFYMRYAITSVFILTSKFTFAHVDNVTRQPTAPNKLIAKFFTTPWINLNNTWTDEVASRCRNDVVTLIESAEAAETWALQMLDAASRVPPGILMGNFHDLGMYDECLGVKSHDNPANIQGQHCMVSLSMPSRFVADAAALLFSYKTSIYNPNADIDLILTISVCMPASCGVDDVTGFANASVQSIPELVAFEVKVTHVTCSRVEPAGNDLALGSILTILFFTMIAAFLLLCTLCDFVMRTGFYNVSSFVRTIAKFSLYTNAMKLLDTKVSPECLPAVHGFRFLGMCLIVIGHRGMSLVTRPAINPLDISKLRQSTMTLIVVSLSRMVDTFFVMSGFLAAYSLLKYLRSGKKLNVLMLYMHRYFRLTPCMAVLILFTIYILPNLGSGPVWQTIIGSASDLCRKNWWTNLLYIQNFVNKHEMCMLHTWHLAVEMHLFWMCPIIVYPLYRWPKLGLTILGAFSIASFIIPAVQIMVYNYSSLFNSSKTLAVMYHEFFNFYTITYNRALPYLIGILLGYHVANEKRHLTKVQVLFNWILAGFIILLCYWATYFIQPCASKYDVVWEMVYVTFVRLGWSIATAWILYACTQGYGGVLTRFLSLPIFVPLSRMSYCIYLVHIVIQTGTNASVRTARFFTPFSELYLVWGDLAMSIAAAFVLNLCFETPAIVLEKILDTKRPSAIVERVSTGKKDNVSAIIRNYYSTGDQIPLRLAAEKIVSQLDLWRTVRLALNDSRRKQARIPTDLAKCLQASEGCRSNMLENESQRESRADAKAVQNRCHQFQTRITTSEQALLTFLQTGANCDWDNIANFGESEITEFVKSSQLDSCDMPDEDSVQLPASNSIPFDKKTN